MSAVGFPSDSQQLVEMCLARLRADARLDDDPILPTIEEIELLPDEDETLDVRADEIIIDCADVMDIPSAASIVRASAHANAIERRDTPTLCTRRPRAAAPRSARWPVVVCALVATYFGVTAFMRSPMGAKPEVQEVVRTSRAQIGGVVSTAVAITKSVTAGRW